VKLKGIIHCHSDLSYDCRVPLAELRRALRAEGFSFVALTEHTRGVTSESYAAYVAACRAHSDAEFAILPGLEVRCDDGAEIAAIGVGEFISEGPVAAVVSRVRELGGYAIWVHPWKRGRAAQWLECDAIEVLNGKMDGTVAPNFLLRREAIRHIGERKTPHLIFGLDLHSLDQPRAVWLECDAAGLDARHIAESIRRGRYASRVAHGGMSSRGEVAFLDSLRLRSLRGAYLAWNRMLPSQPGKLRSALLWLSRPLVRLMARPASNAAGGAESREEGP
jgi:predicted metal-dependent phosphoesterase TrpH